MSRTFKKRILKANGCLRFTGNKTRAYCSLNHSTTHRFWYTQISFRAKEVMRNANRSLNKRTRQYNKKQINLGILEWNNQYLSYGIK